MPQTKTMALEVEEIVDDGGYAMGYLVKGHVSDGELMAAIRDKTSYDTFELAHAKSIERTVQRKVPCRDPGTVWAFMYWPSDPGRGAFECTIAWME